MARPNSSLTGNSIDEDGLSPHSSSRVQGPLSGSNTQTEDGEEESLGFLEKAWLYMTDIDYYQKNRGPQNIDKVRARVIESYNKHGVFYGFTADQQEEIGRKVYESSKAAIPIAEIVATIATLPFSGGATLGSSVALKLGASGVRHAFVKTFVDSLGKEVTAVAIEILAGKNIDYPKRIQQIGIKLALDSTGGALLEKLTPALESGFILLAKKLKNYRIAGLDLSRPASAQQAVDSKIIEQAVSEMVNFTGTVAFECLK